MDIKYLFSPKEKGLADKDLSIYKRSREAELEREVESKRIRGQQQADSLIFEAQKEASRLVIDAETSTNKTLLQADKDLLVATKSNFTAIIEMERDYAAQSITKNSVNAKLDGEIEAKKSLVADLKDLPVFKERAARAEAESKGKDIAIDHLKQDIERLDSLVKFMAGLLPKFELEKVAFNLNADVKVEQGKGGDKSKDGNKGGENKS